jgi:alkaline phosphatase
MSQTLISQVYDTRVWYRILKGVQVRFCGKTVPLCSLARRLCWLSVFVPLMLLGLLSAEASADVGEPLPRIQCLEIYTATIYAEGLSSPDGLAFSPDGVLYVAEEAGGQVSRVEPYGSVTPVLSNLNHPEGIAFDDAGTLYVVEDVPTSTLDSRMGRLMKMTVEGVTTTLATNLDAPEGVVWASDGTLYVTESNVQFTDNPSQYRTRVTAVSSTGEVTRILTNTLLWSYSGITLGPDGLLYVNNEASGTVLTDSIYVVDPSTGARALLASDLVDPEGLRFSADGNFPLYVVEEDIGGGAGRLSRVEADGSHVPFCTGFYNIEDVVVDQWGRLYVSEDTTGSIIRITLGPPNRAHPRDIILLIGDGMGEAHRVAARWSAVGQNGALAMDPLPFGGWERTASLDDPVTDSAAAGTALATGFKTNNGMISMVPDSTPLTVTTILERAQAQGMAVGLVTNVQMAHATPAAFAAHVEHRSMMTEIARQMLALEVDVLLGGGEDEFLPVEGTGVYTGCYPQVGERTDGRNLIDEAVAAGYTYVCDATDLTAVAPTSTTRLLGLFADEGMQYPYSPSLAEMTEQAIAILSQDPEGFFLMVEGGQIDWAGHGNDAERVISDTIDFDQAVAVAQAYASIAGNTLVIVTADHETGGMSTTLTSTGIITEDGPFFMPGGTPFYINWTTSDHTSADVPTTAQGAWSDLLIGTYENTHIHDVMRLALESSPAITLTQAAVPSSGSMVRPGDRITYTLTLTNNGTADASRLVLTNTLPAGVDYVPGSASTTPGLNVAVIPPPALVLTGTLPVDGVLTTTLCVTVSDVLSGTPLVNKVEVVQEGSGLVTSTVMHSVVVIPDLSIAKLGTPANGSFVEPGEWITYTVVVHNGGDPAHDIVLSDTLDLASVMLAVSHTTSGELSGPNPVRVTGFDLAPGEDVTLTLGVTVTGEISGTVIRNQASLTSTETPSPQFSDWVTHVISHTEVTPPSFALTKTANPPNGSLVEPGEWITYTIVAHNGGGLAHDILLSDTLDLASVTLVVSHTTSGELSGPNPVRVTGFDLAPGEDVTLTLGVTVTAEIGGTVIRNQASLTSTETPSLQFSDWVTHVISHTEVTPPSFALTKTASPPNGSFVEQGEWITYTVVAHNGGGPATDVILIDVIPAGTAYVSDSATTNVGEVSFDGVQVEFSVPDFPPGQVLTTTLCVTVTTGTTTITNVAHLVSAQTQPKHSNPINHSTREAEMHQVYLPVVLKNPGKQSLLPQRWPQGNDDVNPTTTRGW